MGGIQGGLGAPINATYIMLTADPVLTAEQLLSAIIGAGTAAARPVAGTAGRLYFNTDTGHLQRDSGVLWVDVEATVASIGAMAPTGTLLNFGETVNIMGSLGGGTKNIDLDSGTVVTATVTVGATTFTFSNCKPTGTASAFTLILTNGGSQTVNWPASVDWVGGTAPSLTAAGVDVLTFLTVDGGTTWRGFAAGLDVK